MTHVVPLHAALPFWAAQTAPHAPQLLTSFRVERSHPSLTSALQFAKPALHVIAQEPFEHLGVPFVASHAAPPLTAFEHAPQLFTSPEVSTSQPLALVGLVAASQSANGEMHDATLQVPVRHVSFAFGRLHFVVQSPH
jgi:hypothetical protein